MPRPIVARLVLALVVAAVAAAPAGALPGDPGFAPTSPAPGATVPVDPDGIPVAFTCPVYRVFTAGTGFTVFGGPADHGVDLSTSAQTGPDGRLAPDGVVARVSGASDGAGGCVASLAAGGSPPRPQETPGSYFWQVWRLCTGCETGYETGPVQALTLRSPAVPRVGAARPYAGFPVLFPLSLAGVPDGTAVRVERRAGARWVRAGSATALGGRGEAVVTLPRGRVTVRAVARIGAQDVAGPGRTLVVAPAGARRATRPADDGRYATAGRGATVRLRVTSGGRWVRDVRAFVPMLCPGVTAGTFMTQIGTLRIARARIAPDGRFVQASVAGGDTSQRVRGRLVGGRVTGRVELSVGPCAGNASYTVRRTGP